MIAKVLFVSGSRRNGNPFSFFATNHKSILFFLTLRPDFCDLTIKLTADGTILGRLNIRHVPLNYRTWPLAPISSHSVPCRLPSAYRTDGDVESWRRSLTAFLHSEGNAVLQRVELKIQNLTKVPLDCAEDAVTLQRFWTLDISPERCIVDLQQLLRYDPQGRYGIGEREGRRGRGLGAFLHSMVFQTFTTIFLIRRTTRARPSFSIWRGEPGTDSSTPSSTSSGSHVLFSFSFGVSRTGPTG